jgi:hypothetical protein
MATAKGKAQMNKILIHCSDTFAGMDTTAADIEGKAWQT